MEKHEVLDFIRRRWSKDSDWTNGNCLWFANILCQRFIDGEIYYLPIRGHFITKIDGVFYDATGVVTTNEAPIALVDIYHNDSLLYSRLIRDCFN